MDEQGYRAFLETRHLDPAAMDCSVAAVREFAAWLGRGTRPRDLDHAGAGDILRYAAELVERGENTEEGMLALARYARVTGNSAAVIAWLELLDGWDVPLNLERRLRELAGDAVREDVFSGLHVPPLGTPAVEKPPYTRALMERLAARVEPETCRTALTSGLHYVPAEAFAEERARYLAATDIDAFIADEHERYIEYLASLRDSGELYFSQPITDAVVEYVRATPTCGPGVRDQAVVRATKIPYHADRYLAEEDPERKRYLACHCMWARESLLRPGPVVPDLMCQCSAGFEKQYWDAVLGQPVVVDVVRSVLRGDPVCEFAVHLPDDVVRADPR